MVVLLPWKEAFAFLGPRVGCRKQMASIVGNPFNKITVIFVLYIKHLLKQLLLYWGVAVMCLRGCLSTARGRVTAWKEEREGVGGQEDPTRDPTRGCPKGLGSEP